MKEKVDLTLVFGIFTSTVAIWVYLYGQIIDLTTTEPSSLSLVYICFLHYLSFVCVSLSFILLLRSCLEASLQKYELLKLKKFQLVANESQRILFSLWGPMFLFGLIAVLSINVFSNSRYEFLKENGGFILGSFLCLAVFFFILRINVFKLLIATSFKHGVLFILFFFLHIGLIAFHAAGIKFKIEKDFYKNDEIARFEIKPRGYFFLPKVEYVIANFRDTLDNGYGYAYFIDLKEDTLNIQPIIEVQYYPQVVEFPLRSYFFINKTSK